MASPAWDAVIEHVPTETRVRTPAVVTVHTPGVVEVYVTGTRPELAVATSVGGVPASGVSGGCVKLIVCGFVFIEKVELGELMLESHGCQTALNDPLS